MACFFPPSQFEAWFLSSAISEEDIRKIEKAVDKSFQKIQEETMRIIISHILTSTLVACKSTNY